MIRAEHRENLFAREFKEFLTVYDLAWDSACVTQRVNLWLWPPAAVVDQVEDVGSCSDI